MGTKRIYWQVNDYSEHDIPEHAAVHLVTGEGGIKVWIDEDGKINLHSTGPFILRKRDETD